MNEAWVPEPMRLTPRLESALTIRLDVRSPIDIGSIGQRDGESVPIREGENRGGVFLAARPSNVMNDREGKMRQGQPAHDRSDQVPVESGSS
jgi:hypothetical protein